MRLVDATRAWLVVGAGGRFPKTTGNAWAQIAVLTCVTTLLTPMAGTSQTAVKRVALVIGAQNYSDVPQLANPLNDANLVARGLSAAGFGNVLKLENPTREGLVRGLREFAELADGADAAFVYFAGHGLEVNGDNWVVPVDAKLRNERDLEFEAIRMTSVLAALRGARVRVVALDACRDNPFLARMRRINETRGLSRGLSGVEVDDVVVLYAAAAGTTASDGAGNSPFAASLARWLPEPGLDVRIMAGKIRDDVLEATRGQQRPFISASISGDALVLSPLRPTAWTGFAFYPISDYWKEVLKQPQASGVVVASVLSRSPASEAGLLEGDLISRLDGEAIDNEAKWRIMLGSRTPGKQILLTVVRSGRPMIVPLVLGVRPPEPAVQGMLAAEYTMKAADPAFSATLLQSVNSVIPDAEAWTSAATVSSQLLRFYPGIRMVEITEFTRKRSGSRARYLFRHPEAKAMDWTNAPIYSLAQHISLTAENVGEYVKFFFDNVSGRHGRFLVAERIGDILWRTPPSEELRRDVVSQLRPLTLMKPAKDGVFTMSVTLIFKDSLFSSIVDVERNGVATLRDEKLLVENLPVRLETW